ncbi:unnamed protein product [Lactuca saligna]|uniref:SecA family profile domain-containing protein n=1 Tax=Lactuca saligna TaxID=75948 RepID=A0AA36EPD8_LACSI|nr:unnamed protein product [Lactuca saligna]
MKNRRERRISVRRPTVPVDRRWSCSSSHHDSQLLFAGTPIPPWFLIHADQSSQSSTIFFPSSILSTRWSNSGSMGASHTDSVKTSLQVYLEIQTRKFLVDYERIPATDEKSPKEHDFDTLVDRISRADLKTEIIFNCQMGHGRITTGMVIATLIYLNRIGASGLGRPVFWHNMREEPVIYINGKPFLLREVERPYKNMLEYTGIYCERVERMEARLKEDILKEPERYGWHHYVLLPRATYFFGPALGPCIAIAYLSVLKDCEIHCFHEGLEVKRLGGLHVIGTSLHESRRIDNQLRGRAGRQGDPGSTRFMVR